MVKDRRPLVSLCLITYNQEKYVEEAIDGVLAQTYSPLEIIISDDASTDSTAARIRRRLDARSVGDRVVLNCNPVNLGLAGHVNLLTHRLASGDLIALAAGDDVSEPDRIVRSVDFLTRCPRAMAVSTALTAIDATGREVGGGTPSRGGDAIYSIEDYVADLSFHVNGPSRMFRRVVAETFGPLQEGCPTEDSTYLLRCLLLGDVGLLGMSLVRYRTHGENMSAPHNIRRMPIDRIKCQYLADVATAERDLGLVPAMKDVILARIEANMQARLAANAPVSHSTPRSGLTRLATWAAGMLGRRSRHRSRAEANRKQT